MLTVAFKAEGLYRKVRIDHGGNVAIPECVLRHRIPYNKLGKIVFAGTAPNIRRIIVELPYRLEEHPVPTDPSDLYAHWPIFNAETNVGFPSTGRANVLYKAEQEATLYQWLESDKRYEPIMGQQAVTDTITGISIDGTKLTPEDGIVSLPPATAQQLGLVKSSAEENSVEVSDSGVMYVNSLNVNKLTQSPDDTLVLNGGNSNT